MKWLFALVVALLAFAWLARRQRASRERDVREPPSPGRSATHADVEQLLAPHAARLEATRRPVVRIALDPMSRDDARANKVGGAAWWPRGTPWPLDSEGRALALLAQIDFAALPRPLSGYPDCGLLQIFIGRDDLYGANFVRDFSIDDLAHQRNFRVVFWPAFDAESAATDVEPSPSADDPSLPSPGLEPPRRMRFSLETETMTLGDYRVGTLFGGDWYPLVEAHAARNGISRNSLAQAFALGREGTGHKIGGYPHFTQVDPRCDGPWELLLQLDTDDSMMWGDCGVANFFIDPADLARADFSRVAYNWDCS